MVNKELRYAWRPADLAGQPRFTNFNTYENESVYIAWKGIIFQNGSEAGVETIIRLATSLQGKPLSQLCRFLHGIFILLVFDKKQAIWSIAVDNAGLYHAFHSSHCIGTSFLDMVSMERSVKVTLCPEAVAEFLALGGVFWSRTLIQGTAKIAFNEIIELRLGLGANRTQKIIVQKELPPPPPSEVGQTAFHEHFRHLAEALKGRCVSVDLTGGIDSRLVACLLKENGLEFEVAVACQPGHPDFLIAQKASRFLGKDFHFTCHDIACIEEELPELFRECDGLGDVLAYHRSHQLSAARRRRGIEVVVTGAGGELYKDFWWLQDWPFYNSKVVNYGRLYDLRIGAIGLPKGYLAGDAAAAYAELRQRTIKKFNTLRADTNTRSYDNVYFFYKSAEVAGRFMTSNINNFFPVMAPFLDYDNFLFGTSLPRSQRFLNRFHRMALSAHCPALADLVTTEGVPASIGKESGLIDLFHFSKSRSHRFVKKIGERFLRRRWAYLPDPRDPEFIPRIRGTPAFRSAVQDLKDAGFLHPSLSIRGIRNSEVGRILTLGMLVRHINP